MRSRKGLAPVIAIAVLVAISGLTFAALLTWQGTFQSDWQTKISLSGNAGPIDILELERINSTHSILGIKNKGGAYHIIQNITIGGSSCEATRSNVIEFSEHIYVNCTVDTKSLYDISVLTDKGLFGKTVTAYDSPLSFTNEGFQFSYSTGICNFAEGYVKIYGMDALSNSHLEDASSSLYTYSACAWHSNYTLGTNQIGRYITFGYLPARNNSNYFSSTGSEIGTVPEWFDMTLSSSGGSFFLNVTTDSSLGSQNYTCIGKFDLDDVYGTHFGDCLSSHTHYIWMKLE